MPAPVFTESQEAADALSHTEWLRDKLARAASDPRPRVPHQQVMDEAQALIDRKRQAHATKAAAA